MIEGRFERAEIPVLCDRVCAALSAHDVDRIVCDVGSVHAPDAVAVDALARLQLAAKRAGRTLTLRRASPVLEGLLTLTGLSGVVPVSVD